MRPSSDAGMKSGRPSMVLGTRLRTDRLMTIADSRARTDMPRLMLEERKRNKPDMTETEVNEF